MRDFDLVERLFSERNSSEDQYIPFLWLFPFFSASGFPCRSWPFLPFGGTEQRLGSEDENQTFHVSVLK